MMLTSIFLDVVKISLTTGLVVAVLLVFSRRLNRTFVAKWKYWVWLLLAARLLVPYSPNLPTAPVRLAVPEVQIVPFQAPANPQLPEGFPEEPAETAEPVEAPVPVAVAGTQRQMATTPIDLVDLLAVGWATGAVLFAGWHTASYWNSKRRLLRWSRRCSDPRVTAMVDQLAEQMGIGATVTPLVCDSIASPMAIGFLRHVLLLPHENYTDVDLYYVIKHELVHIRRRDVWYKLNMLGACALHWFNPAVHLMFREAARDLELACDDEVVKDLPGQSRVEYSETILAAAAQNSLRCTALVSNFRDGSWSLKERFHNLLGGPKRRGISTAVALLLCTVLVGSMVACGSTTHQDDENVEAFLDGLTQQYLTAPFEAGLLTRDWEVEDLTPDDLVRYYARRMGFVEGIPMFAEELESGVEQDFGVAAEFLRTATLINRGYYESDGTGDSGYIYANASFMDSNSLEITYKMVTPEGNPIGSGEVRLTGRNGEYRYESNRFTPDITWQLTYPDSGNVTVLDNVMSMTTGDTPLAISTHYLNLLPTLGAIGENISPADEETWLWEGTYDSGKPLRVEVSGPYTTGIVIVYGEGETPAIGAVGPLLDVQPTDWTNLTTVSRAYVWPLIHSGGAIGYTWERAGDIDAYDLVNVVAYNNLLGLEVEPAGATIFGGAEYVQKEAPAAEVEAIILRHFPGVTVEQLREAAQYNQEAGTYAMGAGWGGGWAYVATNIAAEGENIVIDVSIRNFDEPLPIPHSKLTLQVTEDGVTQYISNERLSVLELPFRARDVASIAVAPGVPTYDDMIVKDDTYILQFVDAFESLRIFETELNPDDFPDRYDVVFALGDGRKYEVSIIGSRLLEVDGKLYEYPRSQHVLFEMVFGNALMSQYDREGYYSIAGVMNGLYGGYIESELDTELLAYAILIKGEDMDSFVQVWVDDVVDMTGNGWKEFHEGDNLIIKYTESYDMDWSPVIGIPRANRRVVADKVFIVSTDYYSYTS